jgi:DNA-binding transcriptional LysR family regulator
MKQPSLSELNAVAKVAQTRSFRGAARELGASPSALSHAISTLERRLGVRLFQRSTRSVALTDEGEAFVECIGRALHAIDRAVEDVHQHSAVPRGTLRLVSPRGPAYVAVLPAVLETRRRHPDVHIELVTDARMIDIVAEGFDAGIRYAGTVPQDMVATPCGSDLNVAIVASPAYLKHHPAPKRPQDLADHECIRYHKASGTVKRWELRVKGRAIAIEVAGKLVLDDEAFLIDAALGGVGLAYVARAAAARHLASGALVAVLDAHAPRFEPVQLFYPSGVLVRAALRAFIAVVKSLR